MLRTMDGLILYSYWKMAPPTQPCTSIMEEARRYCNILENLSILKGTFKYHLIISDMKYTGIRQLMDTWITGDLFSASLSQLIQIFSHFCCWHFDHEEYRIVLQFLFKVEITMSFEEMLIIVTWILQVAQW